QNLTWRLTISGTNLGIAIVVLQGGGAQHSVVHTKTYPAGAKPSSVPAPLKGKHVISAGVYLIEDRPVTRVYRYSFTGSLDDFVNSAMRQLKGWRTDLVTDYGGKQRPGAPCQLTGPDLPGHVGRQSMAVVNGRFVLDKAAAFGA